MIIGINLLYMLPGVVGGTETYAAGLLGGLGKIDKENEYIIYVNVESGNWAVPEAENFRLQICPITAVNRGKRYYYEQFKLPSLLKRDNVNVVHSLGYVAPLYPGCPSVVTIPDLNYKAFGNQMSRTRRLSLGFFVRRSALHADYVISISHFSRSEILNNYPIGDDRVVVTHLAPRQMATYRKMPAEEKTPAPYFVAFSSQSPHKNIPALLRAFAGTKDRIPHRLVLIGSLPNNADYRSLVRDLKLESRISFTGYVEESRLQDTLQGATALIFPSIYEGFGLPILEAMELGVPVACSRKASLPEIAGDAALFFDPHSIEEIGEKMIQLATDGSLREDLRKKGFENVRRFSWEETASETLAVYKKAVEKKISRL